MPATPTYGHRAALAAIVVLAALAYSNSFTGAFVFDDLQHVRDNLRIRDLGAFVSWSGYLATRHRFVGYVTFALNYALGKLSVTDYHLVNFVIHAASAAVVYVLVVLAFRTPRLRGSELAGSARAVAFLAAALFATHPIQTQAVTYIVQRFTSLATLFYLVAVVLFLRWRMRRQAVAAARVQGFVLYFAMLASAILSMKTKEIAFTLPLAIVLCELSFFEPLPWRRRLFLLPIAATLLIVPATYVSYVSISSPALAQATRVDTPVSRLEYLLTQAPVVQSYLRLLVWPTGQSVDHDFRMVNSVLEPRVIGSIVGLGALAVLAFVLYRRTAPGRTRSIDPAARLAAFGIAWFFLTLAVESSVIPIVDVMNEHRVYLPSVGAFAAAAVLTGLAVSRVSPRHAGRTLVAAAVILSVPLGVATFLRNRVWASEVSLWSDAARKAPDKSRPHVNLGTALAVAGRLEEGARELRRAVDLDPGSSYARAQLGAAFLASGRLPEAEIELREADRLRPGDPDVLFNLAVVLNRTGRRDEAKTVLRRFLDVAPPAHTARRLAERALR